MAFLIIFMPEWAILSLRNNGTHHEKPPTEIIHGRFCSVILSIPGMDEINQVFLPDP